MMAVLVAHLALAAGVAPWFVFPPERANGTGPLEALAPGALWPLPVLCLIAFALLCWASPENEPERGDPSTGPGA